MTGSNRRPPGCKEAYRIRLQAIPAGLGTDLVFVPNADGYLEFHHRDGPVVTADFTTPAIDSRTKDTRAATPSVNRSERDGPGAAPVIS